MVLLVVVLVTVPLLDVVVLDEDVFVSVELLAVVVF